MTTAICLSENHSKKLKESQIGKSWLAFWVAWGEGLRDCKTGLGSEAPTHP